MYPARWFFNKHEEPTTEVAIRRKFHEDLYLNMPTFQVADQTANLEIVINPLVNWIWLGFAVMALGTGIVLLPERTFAFAMAKFPAPEVATTAGMLLLMLCLAAPALAQHTETGGTVPVAMYSPLERELQRDIICMCGTCGRKNLAECTCSKAAEMRTELSGLVKEGKTREDVIQYLRRQVRQPGAARIADRQGIQSAGVVLPVRRRRLRRHCRRVRRQKMVAALARRAAGAAAGRSAPPKTPQCRRASTASSKTSISPLPPTQPTSDSLRPWQFFTLGALVCATAAVFIIRGTSAENLIFVCLGIFAAALVGLAALQRAASARDGRDA